MPQIEEWWHSSRGSVTLNIVSEREARPGAPRPPATGPKPPAVQPNRPANAPVAAPSSPANQSPRPPQVRKGTLEGFPARVPPAPTPAAPAVAAVVSASQAPPPMSKQSEPPESGWETEADDEMELRSSSVIAAADDVRPPQEQTAVLTRPQSSPDMTAPVARRARSVPDLGGTASMTPNPPRVPTPRAKQSSPDLLPELPAPGQVSIASPQASIAAVAPQVSIAATPQAPQVSAAPKPPVAAGSSPAPQAPAGAMQTLSAEAQEQLMGVLRGALEATLLPLLEKQQVLEARLEWLNQQDQKAAAAAAAAAAARASVVSAPPVRAMAPSLSVDITEATMVRPAGVSLVPRASIHSTSYGLVMEVPKESLPPTIEQQLANVGPIDLPDFGANRRVAGRLLIALLLAGVVSAVAAMILSYT